MKPNFNLASAPAVFNEEGRNSKYVGLDGLKGIHVSFSGYSIADGEKILFPSDKDLEKNPTKFIKVMATRKGSTNKSALIRCNRIAPGATEAHESWFNLSVLSREKYDAEGKRSGVDAFRDEMRSLADDSERVSKILGKQLIGTGIESAYAVRFKDGAPALDANGARQYDPYDYVTVELQDVEA